MPRETKAHRILKQARERMEKARINADEAEAALRVAQAAFNAHQQAYLALERELIPKPRKQADPKPAPPAEQKELKSVKPAKCDVCYEEENFAVHDKSFGYADYHPFVPPKSAQRAGRRSSRKGAEAQSTASVETSAEGVSDVQSVAAGG